MEREIKCRQLEQESKWREAGNMWLTISRKADANACFLIADSIEKGDAYREDVQQRIGKEPEFTSTNVRAWQQWHKDLGEIYNQHFKR
jgi:hypothetical protein